MTKSYINLHTSKKLTVYFVVKILSPVVDIILIIVLGVVHGVDMIKNVGVVHVYHLINIGPLTHPHTPTIGGQRIVAEVSVGWFVGTWTMEVIGYDVWSKLLIRFIEHHFIIISLNLLILVVVTGGAGAAAFNILDSGCVSSL